jgi:mycothiol synthase
MDPTSRYPHAPGVAGLLFRHLRAPDDYRPMNAIANAVRAAEGESWATSDEQFQRFYETLSNCDTATDVVIVEGGGRVVGYGRVGWHEELDGHRVYETVSFADPSQTFDGLLAALQDIAEARGREVAAGHPTGPKSFDANTGATAVAREQILRERGYAAARYGYRMVRSNLDDLPDAHMPDGLEIRDVRPEQLRAIWEADVEAFRDHWGTTVPTEQDYQLFLTDPVQGDTTLWRVAWDGDQVAGMVRSFVNDEENRRYGRTLGYVENISVRQPWRRRGLARALIAASFPLLRARGMNEAALGVDTENASGALQLYESCGFVAVSRETTWRKRFE